MLVEAGPRGRELDAGYGRHGGKGHGERGNRESGLAGCGGGGHLV
jgi:hypothetical protein